MNWTKWIFRSLGKCVIHVAHLTASGIARLLSTGWVRKENFLEKTGYPEE